MIATPDDYSWFSPERFPGLADAYCFTYVRGLTPEEVVTRLGVRVEDCSRVTLDGLIRRQTFGAVAVGDWVLLVEACSGLGITEEIIMPLSAGTRLVSHFYLDVDDMDYFYWIDDGKIRFEFAHQEGYPIADPHTGPAFLLAEHLTGITMTPRLLEESTYLCGVVPGWR
ncbi:DUF6461 domain-containing protein [Nonomuraea wenchangensis]